MNLDRIIAVRNNKTVYRDGDFCIKVFNTGFSKSEILREAFNQAAAEEMGVNVPAVKEVTEAEGRLAIVSDYKDGKTLEMLMAEKNDKKYLTVLASLQLELQKIACPNLNKQKEKIASKIEQADIPDEKKSLLQHKLYKMHDCASLCHGDLVPSNVILSDNKTYVIDWENASSGDGAADTAQTYLRLRLDTDAETADEYLKILCKNGNTDILRIHEWMPIVAASMLADGNAREREFFRLWI